MNPRLTWKLLLVCAASLLALVPGAQAKPGYSVFPGYRSAELNLKGSNGYAIHVAKERGEVLLSVDKELNFATYFARSLRPERDRIEAKFPGIGRISVRFRPDGPPRRKTPEPFPGCRGGETVEQRGHFVGTIRLRGERGYTAVKATRAPGKVVTSAKEVCKRSESDNGLEIEGTELHAYSISKGEGVAFYGSTRSDPVNSSFFSGTVVERRRGMSVYRHVIAIGAEDDLVPGDTRPFPLSATVTPPAPFQGSGEFQRTPAGEKTWVGSLAVSFPGLADPVTLAGPAFTAKLCRNAGCDQWRRQGEFSLTAAKLSLPG